jgi:hypothetical protein
MKPVRILLAFACIAAFALTCSAQDNITATDLIARHLNSIGPAAVRAGIKSRLVRGHVQMNVIGGVGTVNGSAMVVSLGRQLSIAFQVNDPQIKGEQFVFDGAKTQIALVAPATRSTLGQFMYQQDQLLRDGLVGGTLLTAWPLYDPKLRDAKVKYNGLKKIDGRELYELSYEPKKADRDLLIHLYVEPETFRHVKSTYDFTVPPSFAHNQLQHGNYSRIRVEETFSDFRPVDGLTLPWDWTLRCTSYGNTTSIIEWHMTADNITHNNVTE